MIHERRLVKDVKLNGPIRGCLQIVREQLAMLETAEKLEEEGFKQLVDGSQMSLEQLRERAMNSFYMMAEEAQQLGLVADIVS